jgi:DMSO/TMAO reductase YedYZ molybdopterin-dependent catalytic subunit
MTHDIIGYLGEKAQTKNKIITISLVITFLLFPLIASSLASASSNNQWNLTITNLSGTIINLTYDDLLALPKTIVGADLSCYGLLISSGEWGGVKLSDLLDQAGIDPSVSTINFVAQDGYSVNLPISIAMRIDIIVAYDFNGAPLTEVLRLVVPEENGNIWIAGITSISMSNSPVNQVESGSSGPSIINQYQAIINTTSSSPEQLQNRVETQPLVPNNKTAIKTLTPSTNSTVQQSEQKNATQQDNVFSFNFDYWVLLGVVIAAVAMGFVVYKLKEKPPA